VGLDALARSARPQDTLASVFTSSCGDGQVIHQICEALASPAREVSPTRFHNSVHNAPAGYWSIALRSQAPSTSLCAFDWSFVAGLLEACVYCLTEAEPVLLISYDVPYLEPLHAARPITQPLGAALLLAPQATSASLARLDVQIEAEARAAAHMQDPALERLRSGNPTGRALPLLRALAGPASATLGLEYLDSSAVSVVVTPC
jgi:lambda repressor-like predicted transcriptional regulator